MWAGLTPGEELGPVFVDRSMPHSRTDEVIQSYRMAGFVFSRLRVRRKFEEKQHIKNRIHPQDSAEEAYFSASVVGRHLIKSTQYFRI